jgi:hypothetical protein
MDSSDGGRTIRTFSNQRAGGERWFFGVPGRKMRR